MENILKARACAISGSWRRVNFTPDYAPQADLWRAEYRRLADRPTPHLENSLYGWMAKGPWDREQGVLRKLARRKGPAWVLGTSLCCPRIPPWTCHPISKQAASFDVQKEVL